MKKKKISKLVKLTTSKMPGETEQEYHSWLLYLEIGSIDKVHSALKKVALNGTEVAPKNKHTLLHSPGRRTLARWSKKHRWPERTELQLQEELAKIKQKTERYREQRKYLITDILIEKTNKIRREVSQKEATILELKYLWEMHRTEFGESTGNTQITHRINENDQVPLTPEEEKIGREIDNVIKKHYGRKSQ